MVSLCDVIYFAINAFSWAFSCRLPYRSIYIPSNINEQIKVLNQLLQNYRKESMVIFRDVSACKPFYGKNISIKTIKWVLLLKN